MPPLHISAIVNVVRNLDVVEQVAMRIGYARVHATTRDFCLLKLLQACSLLMHPSYHQAAVGGPLLKNSYGFY